MGYAEKQIPPWAARPETPSIAPPPELTAKQMAGQTADAGQTARQTTGEEQPQPAEIHAPREGTPRSPAPAGQPQPSILPQPSPQASPSAPVAVQQVSTGVEQPSADELQQDELVRFLAEHPDYAQQARDRGLVPYNGRLYQVITGPDGRPQMLEASPRDVPKPPRARIRKNAYGNQRFR